MWANKLFFTFSNNAGRRQEFICLQTNTNLSTVLDPLDSEWSDLDENDGECSSISSRWARDIGPM